MLTIFTGSVTLHAVLWLIAAIVFSIVEIGTTQLVSVWFAIGALAAMVVALFTTSLWAQFIVFFIVSATILVLIRPLVKRKLVTKSIPTNVDALIGKVGVVTVDIDNIQNTGRVKVSGMDWTARSFDGAPIPIGKTVGIKYIDGVKLIVEPFEIQSPASGPAAAPVPHEKEFTQENVLVPEPMDKDGFSTASNESEKERV